MSDQREQQMRQLGWTGQCDCSVPDPVAGQFAPCSDCGTLIGRHPDVPHSAAVEDDGHKSCALDGSTHGSYCWTTHTRDRCEAAAARRTDG